MVYEDKIAFLNNAISAIEDASLKLQDALSRKDSQSAIKLKSFILNLQKKIDDILK